MSSAQTVFATLEPVLRARVRDDLDVLALATHCCVTAAGWTLAEQAEAPADDNFIVKPDWTSQESTAFAYRNAAGTALLVTAVKFGDGVLHVNAFADGAPELAATLVAQDCLDTSSGARRVCWPVVEQQLGQGVLAKLPGKPTATTAASAAQTTERQREPGASLREPVGPPPMRAGPDRGWGGDVDPLRDPRFPSRPMMPPLGIGRPSGLGSRDLDPFATGPGGGMFAGPEMFDPRRYARPQPGWPQPPPNGSGRLPPGAVPPGARFDPIYPEPGAQPNRQPSRPRGGPDNDEFMPPGYDDMFM